MRLELEPEMETFIVAPQTNQGIRIVGENEVC